MKSVSMGAHFCSLKLSLKTHIVMLLEVLEGVWSCRVCIPMWIHSSGVLPVLPSMLSFESLFPQLLIFMGFV